MSPSPRAVLAALVAGAGACLASAGPAAGHALNSSFQLPVPLWLYLWGSAAAVGASFVVAALVVAPPGARPTYPLAPLPAAPTVAAAAALRVIGLGGWTLTIVAGLSGALHASLPAVIFWIFVWVGVPVAAVLVGNPWPALSPFRAAHALLQRAGRLFGARALDAGLRYPAGLARWPAVAALFAALWYELALPGALAGGVVAAMLLGYTLITLLGMLLFGGIPWLRNAELFEVLFGWFGRIGPIGRRSRSAELCEDCGERCTVARCVDCPECAVAEEHGERRAVLRPPFAGLTDVERADASDAAFILLALAGVSYDGLRETVAWGPAAELLYTAVLPFVGPLHAFTLASTLGLAGLWIAFMALFLAAVGVTRRIGRPRAALGASAGTYAATLLPIAGGYLVAHYFTLLLQGVLWLPALLGDPRSVSPELDWLPPAFVWYLSVGAIVIGHIAAVVLAHRLALRDGPRRAVLTGLPLVVLMIGYTIFSLWIIAQPITLEPG